MQSSVRTIRRWKISGKLDSTAKDLVEHSRVCEKGLYTVKILPQTMQFPPNCYDFTPPRKPKGVKQILVECGPWNREYTMPTVQPPMAGLFANPTVTAVL